MKISKAVKRDKKRHKRNKMVIVGKSIFLIQQIIINRAEKKSKKKK